MVLYHKLKVLLQNIIVGLLQDGISCISKLSSVTTEDIGGDKSGGGVGGGGILIQEALVYLTLSICHGIHNGIHGGLQHFYGVKEKMKKYNGLQDS